MYDTIIRQALHWDVEEAIYLLQGKRYDVITWLFSYLRIYMEMFILGIGYDIVRKSLAWVRILALQ